MTLATDLDQLAIDTIRTLSIDGVQKANSGHPGAPMGAALMGIGKRSAVLNEAALKVARDVGPIEFTSASGECEPFDVVKHLTADRLKEKLGV